MIKHIFKIAILGLSLSIVSLQLSAQTVTEPQDTPAEWAKAYTPFQLAGNLYYVGTYDLACYLITTSKGNILINTGLAASASLIKANIEKLGFKFADTKILLTTQAHYDHMGAVSAIKQSTGARIMVDEKDSDVLADGGSSDYALGGNGSTYQPANADRLLTDGDTVSLGNMELVMLHHPGHTKGSCSFLFDVKDKTRSYRVLIANMPTIVTKKSFLTITDYPDIAKDYAYTLSSMKKLSFDLWFSSHASQFDLHRKHKSGDHYNPLVFSDRKGYDAAIKDLEQQFQKHP